MAVLALIVSSCGGAVEADRQRTEGVVTPMPTQSDGFSGEDALIQGVLRGDATNGCLWLEGPTGEPFGVLWPAGYTAMFNPARLVGPDGKVIAREGDIVSGGGGYYEESIPQCHFGEETVVRIHGIEVEEQNPAN